MGGFGWNTPWEKKATRETGIGLRYNRGKWSASVKYLRLRSQPNYNNLAGVPALEVQTGVTAGILNAGYNELEIERDRTDITGGYRMYGTPGADDSGARLDAMGGLRRLRRATTHQYLAGTAIEIFGVGSGSQVDFAIDRHSFGFARGPVLGLDFRYRFPNRLQLRAALSVYDLRGYWKYRSLEPGVLSSNKLQFTGIEESADYRVEGTELELGVRYPLATKFVVFVDLFSEASSITDHDVRRFTVSSDAFTSSRAYLTYLAAASGDTYEDEWGGLRFGFEISL